MNSLDIHVYKRFFLNGTNIPLYSKEDFKAKFWSHILEELFSLSNVCLHWGDTVPKAFKNVAASPRVDIRIVSALNSNDNDCSLGEFSKIAVSTKLYEDKIKLALMAKKHFNSLLKAGVVCQYPFIMVMGFDFMFLTMEYAEGIGYVIHEVDQCQFPIIKSSINEGGIQALINCINSVKVHVTSLKEKREDERKEHAIHRMKLLIGESSTQAATYYRPGQP